MTCMDHIITYKRGLSGSFRSIRQALNLGTSPGCRRRTLNREKATHLITQDLFFILDSPALNCATHGRTGKQQFGERSHERKTKTSQAPYAQQTLAAKSEDEGQNLLLLFFCARDFYLFFCFGPEFFSGASADNSDCGAEREGDGTW